MVQNEDSSDDAEDDAAIAAHFHHDRLYAFYKVHNPDKLVTVEATLDKYAGQEEILFQKLATKYGEINPMQPWLTEFYKDHNPEKLATIEPTLISYAGRELDLYLKIIHKYAQQHAAAHDEAASEDDDAEDTFIAEHFNHDRLSAFYKVHNPDKLATVDATLDKYEGREEVLFEKLATKYGGVNPTKPWLMEFYQHHNPNKLNTVDATLDKYAGRELDLYLKVTNKYAPPGAAAHVEESENEVDAAADGEAVTTKVPNEGSNDSSEDTFLAEHFNHDRLSAFYTVYNPDKLSTVETTLQKYEGQEEALFEKLQNKYGGVNITQPWLMAFYQQHNPDKVPTVDATLDKYAGRELELYLKLNEKYAHQQTAARDEASEDDDNDADVEDISNMVQHEGSNDSEDTFISEHFNHDRLSAFYKVHNPNKLDRVNTTLETYEGREEALFEKLQNKYGGVNPTKPWLTAFYQHHNPAKLNTVDATLDKYAGRELDLYTKLNKKYTQQTVLDDDDAEDVLIVEKTKDVEDTAEKISPPREATTATAATEKVTGTIPDDPPRDASLLWLTGNASPPSPERSTTTTNSSSTKKNRTSKLAFWNRKKKKTKPKKQTTEGSDGGGVATPEAPNDGPPVIQHAATEDSEIGSPAEDTASYTSDFPLSREATATAAAEHKVTRIPPSVGADKYSSGSTNREFNTKRLMAMYTKHQPTQLDSIEATLRQYHGTEAVLLHQLETQYHGENPTAVWLTAFYTQYNPGRVSTVAGMLEAYQGKEEEMFLKLTMKYNDPPMAEDDDSNDNNDDKAEEEEAAIAEQFHQDRLSAFYQVHNPDKLATVAATLKKYQGREETMFEKLASKYDVNPTQPWLKEFYQQHNPEKLETVDATLEKYAGRELELYLKVTHKYAQQQTSSTAHTVASPADDDAEDATIAKNFNHDRLYAFYKVHNPAKLDRVETTLKKYAGREEAMFDTLETKYGVNPTKPWLMEFYQQHNPEKLDTIDATLDKYSGREVVLYLKVIHKYANQKVAAHPEEERTTVLRRNISSDLLKQEAEAIQEQLDQEERELALLEQEAAGTESLRSIVVVPPEHQHHEDDNNNNASNNTNHTSTSSIITNEERQRIVDDITVLLEEDDDEKKQHPSDHPSDDKIFDIDLVEEENQNMSGVDEEIGRAIVVDNSHGDDAAEEEYAPHPIFAKIERHELRDQRKQEGEIPKHNYQVLRPTTMVSYNEDDTSYFDHDTLPGPSLLRLHPGHPDDPTPEMMTPQLELPLTNDMYAFIAAAPVQSYPFLFALYVISTKYIVLLLLAFGITFTNIGVSSPKDNAVKFFLIPVAVAMQEDLIHVYATAASLLYTDRAQSIAPACTKSKLVLAYLLRFCDGILNLYVNFALMLNTSGVLNIFLNFAALHFLQGIDDIFYELSEQGFFGDGMEYMSVLCKQIYFPKRGITTTNCSGFITTDVDAGMLLTTLLTCFIIYGVYISGVLDYVNPELERKYHDGAQAP